MQIKSETINQHFISQVEQRLNACNPQAEKKSRKIYSFRVVDRENYEIQLENNKGKSIENNLSSHDLFSFDVVDKTYRDNFEALFGEHEKNIETHTKSLLEKLEVNNRDELLNLFLSKILSSFRNPYCIQKTINTIGEAAKYHPLNRQLSAICEKIEKGKRPHQKRLCSELGITAQLYHDWLKSLFILLMRTDREQLNILEQIVKSLFENESLFVNIIVFQYTGETADKRVLLSDRSFSVTERDGKHLVYDFNLCSNAFVRYVFVDLEKAVPENTPARFVEAFKQQRNSMSVRFENNNLDALSRYNKNTVYQSYERVYCSSKIVYGLEKSSDRGRVRLKK